MTTAHLVLENGIQFCGRAFGASATVVAEIVFNTAMTGYQEIITDPSYYGQMVVMTTPHVGNVGVNPEDMESRRPWLSGLIVRDISPMVSSWRAAESLPDFLARWGIPGISQVDTRTLTRHIREQGAMRAALSTDPSVSPGALLELARAWEGLEGRDLVQQVTQQTITLWDDPGDPAWHPLEKPRTSVEEREAPHVLVYDFGVKRNILRRLAAQGARVTVLPASTSAQDALALEPDGVVLSNGPGDPAGIPYAVMTATQLLESGLPLLGICLGHQVLGLALGARTYKLPFGHHGGNQPVQEATSGRVQITAQNHNYAVTPDDLPSHVAVTHWNLNDGTVEGMALMDRPVFSVQYHPEASPGPHDADHLFAQFLEQVHAQRARAKSHMG